MSQPYRIAVGTIFTESNHLVGTFTDLACFERTELRRGPQVLESTDGVVGGMLAGLRDRGADIVPLLVATAVPGGILSRECYLSLKTELLRRLRESLPVDGVLLPLHGGAAVEEIGDLEGDLVEAVRHVVGPEVPIVGTLDLHAHVSEKMVAGTEALLAWETYPHRDTYSTGVRGVRMLLDILDGKVRPAMAMAKVPVIVGGIMGSTEGSAPFADVMRFAKAMEQRPGVLSTSTFLVQPYLDHPGMGGGGLVITDGDITLAVELSTQIAEMYWERRFDLEPRVWSPREAIIRGLEMEGGPILLLETADSVGGGAAGDSVATLRALLESDAPSPALVPVVDPEAAARCHQAGAGSEIDLTLGHNVDSRWGRPMTVTGRVERLTDGKFVYSGGIWGGQVADMGPSVWLRIGSVEVLICTYPTYDWADEQYRSVGMDTRNAKFIVVKNPMNYRVGYEGKFAEALVLDTPGPTPAVLRHVRFRELKGPYFPAQEEIPGLRPVVLRRERSGGFLTADFRQDYRE